MTLRRDLTKAQRRRLRELGAVAYERELATELARLEAAFQRWRAEELNVFELSDLIHEFHQGPSRDLFLKYQYANVELAVASAIDGGMLAEAEVEAEELDLGGSYLASYREQKER